MVPAFPPALKELSPGKVAQLIGTGCPLRDYHIEHFPSRKGIHMPGALGS
jgi:hypothetical protein